MVRVYTSRNYNHISSSNSLKSSLQRRFCTVAPLCLGFTKLSIARCFQRIFFTRAFCIAAYAVMVCTIAWSLQTILVGVLKCQPIELNWDPNARGTCGDQTIAFTSVAAVDIATDLMLIILPLKPLIALQIRTSHKIALCLIFGAGLITIVVTAIRLYTSSTP
ncbi:hypothetical protein F4804DRAFT_327394 [Jackrogersella minutella]|nr:hypothetical protein F4804DRAFT_327394 [Jackrogersella minutella]